MKENEDFLTFGGQNPPGAAPAAGMNRCMACGRPRRRFLGAVFMKGSTGNEAFQSWEGQNPGGAAPAAGMSSLMACGRPERRFLG